MADAGTEPPNDPMAQSGEAKAEVKKVSGRSASGSTILSREEELALLRRAAQGDRTAADRLITSHLPFVCNIARRYSRYGAPVNDLVQEGVIGLMQAVRKFNPDSGARLSTYAGWWVRVAIQEHVVSSWSLVRIGTTAAQKALFFRLRRMASDLSREDWTGADSPMRRLAARFHLGPEELQAMARRIAGRDQSLHQPAAGPEGRSEWLDQVPDERANPEQHTAAVHDGRFWHEKLRAALAELPEREQAIISRRYLTDAKISLEAVAREVGLSKERVRQLEAHALGRLRQMLDAAGAAMPSRKLARR